MPISEQDRAAVRTVKERVEDSLLTLPGVVGVDIDEKETAGRRTGIPALVVYVSRKLPPEEVPEGQLIPTEIEGVRTDVRELRIALQDAGP